MKRVSMLIWVVVFLMTGPVEAVESEEVYAANQLRILDIMRGYTDGSLQLDQPIIRSEVATMMVRVFGKETSPVEGQGKTFVDVEADYWGHTYIQKAYKLKIIQGYPNDQFKPLSNITYAEVVAMMVNTLGYQEEVSGEWPLNYINKGKELGIIPEDAGLAADTEINRGQMALIVWDTLIVKD